MLVHRTCEKDHVINLRCLQKLNQLIQQHTFISFTNKTSKEIQKNLVSMFYFYKGLLFLNANSKYHEALCSLLICESWQRLHPTVVCIPCTLGLRSWCCGEIQHSDCNRTLYFWLKQKIFRSCATPFEHQASVFVITQRETAI